MQQTTSAEELGVAIDATAAGVAALDGGALNT